MKQTEEVKKKKGSSSKGIKYKKISAKELKKALLGREKVPPVPTEIRPGRCGGCDVVINTSDLDKYRGLR